MAFFPSQIMDERLFDVDAAFISHVHQDHYDTKFLKVLQKRIFNLHSRWKS